MTKISERAKEAAGLPTQAPRGEVVHIRDGAMTGPPPGMSEEEMQATAGMGLSNKQGDNITPTIYILHYTSSLVDERSGDYIPGARPGDFLLRGAPEDEVLIKAEEGFLFQPCVHWNSVTEWVPSVGGSKRTFVAVHGDVNHPVDRAGDVPGAKEGPKGKWSWVTGDGKHELEERRNFVGFVYLRSGTRMPFLIPFKGTGHAVGKTWMTSMNNKTDERGRRYAMWAGLHVFRTEPRQKDNNRWFMFTVQGNRWATPEERVYGKQLYEQFMSGEKVAETPMDLDVGDSMSADASRVDENI